MGTAALRVLADEIKNETVTAANTATRVGTALLAIINNSTRTPTDWDGITDISSSLEGDSYRMWPNGQNFEDEYGDSQLYPQGTIMTKLNDTPGLDGENWSLR